MKSFSIIRLQQAIKLFRRYGIETLFSAIAVLLRMIMEAMNRTRLLII